MGEIVKRNLSNYVYIYRIVINRKVVIVHILAFTIMFDCVQVLGTLFYSSFGTGLPRFAPDSAIASQLAKTSGCGHKFLTLSHSRRPFQPLVWRRSLTKCSKHGPLPRFCHRTPARASPSATRFARGIPISHESRQPVHPL